MTVRRQWTSQMFYTKKVCFCNTSKVGLQGCLITLRINPKLQLNPKLCGKVHKKRSHQKCHALLTDSSPKRRRQTVPFRLRTAWRKRWSFKWRDQVQPPIYNTEANLRPSARQISESEGKNKSSRPGVENLWLFSWRHLARLTFS